MPPSGFNQNAINGLLIGVRESYIAASNKYNDLLETEKLEHSCNDLELIIDSFAEVMGISREGAGGYITFITENQRSNKRNLYG